MEGQQTAVQMQQDVFGPTLDPSNSLPCGYTGNVRRSLRFCGDGMQDVSTPDAPALNERTKRLNDSLYFWKFRHEMGRSSRRWLKG